MLRDILEFIGSIVLLVAYGVADIAWVFISVILVFSIPGVLLKILDVAKLTYPQSSVVFTIGQAVVALAFLLWLGSALESSDTGETVQKHQTIGRWGEKKTKWYAVNWVQK